MAALRVREDSTNGQLMLEMPLLPRLGSIFFGLVWLGFAGLFLVPFAFGGQVDLGMAIFFIVFAVLPSLSSFFSALTSTTIVIDRGQRSVSINKRLLSLPTSSQAFSFADITNIELQRLRTNSRTVWQVYAVSRDGKRTRLNWNGTQNEMTDLAQKISALAGVPVTEGRMQMPVALEQMLEKVAPNAKDLIEQAQATEPAMQTPDAPATDSYAPPMLDASTTTQPPTVDVLSIDQASTIDETPLAETAPSTDLNSLSIQALEQRIASDERDSDARYALARKYHARGQVDKAIALYQEAMRLDPTNTAAQNDLGVAWQQRGKRTEAEAAYRRAIALDPFSTTAHLNLGLLLRAQNRAADASQEFFQARQNARGDAETRMAEAVSTGTKMEPQLSKT
jgi:tetratricopeptide (TPR) repeat protein